MNEGIHVPWNRNMMKIFITNVIISLQFTFKMNSTNTAKESIYKLCNRNMTKTFITNVIVLTQFTYKLNSINTIKIPSLNSGKEIL